MPNKTKTNVKKGKGVTPSPKKQYRKAAKRSQATVALQQDWVSTEVEFMGDEALSGPLQDMADHMDNMMVMILELSNKVHGQDKVVLD